MLYTQSLPPTSRRMELTQPKTARGPVRTELRLILQLSLIFAALKLAIQIVGNILAQHAGYGIFRDEM